MLEEADRGYGVRETNLITCFQDCRKKKYWFFLSIN